MTGYSLVWQELAQDEASEGALVRRVLPHLDHDVFLGEYRPSGARFVEARLRGSKIGHMPVRSPRMQGMELKIVLESQDKAVIHLREAVGQRTSQFEDVVDDVLDLLEADPGDGATARTVERLLAWQEFFARGRGQLSHEAAAGLYAELYLLAEVMIPAFGVPSAVAHWTGPDPALQDFQMAGGAIEVKSSRGTGSGRINVSSERQLDTDGAGSLFIVYIELDERQDGTGQRLDEAVDSLIKVVAPSPSAAAQFESKLLSAGWKRDEERSERYFVRLMEAFEVRDDFPRLISADLPAGVGNVQYSVDRAAMVPFKVEVAAMLVRMGADHG